MLLQKQSQELSEKTLQENKEALHEAKQRIEAEIKRLDTKEIHDHTRILMRDLHEITASLATMQDMMNLVWKRTEQLKEEISILAAKTQ